MNFDFSKDRVLAVVAHPDDAELLCDGTLARAKTDGAAIGICVCCQGDRGQPAMPIPNLGAVRRKEMAAAAKLLGAELYPGKVSDGTLNDSLSNRRWLTEVFRKFRPTLVLAHAPEDYHPDHRAASALAEAASWFCASRGQKTASAPLSSPPAIWWMDTINMSGFAPGFFVDVTAYQALKERLLECHRSQMARSGDKDFSPMLDLVRLQSHTRGMQSNVAAAEAFRLHVAFKRVRAW